MEGRLCLPLGCLLSPSPVQTPGRPPFWGSGGELTDHREGPAEGREGPGLGARGCTPAHGDRAGWDPGFPLKQKQMHQSRNLTP